MEEEWEAFAQPAFQNGFAKVAYMGSCCLIAVILDNKLYVANLGDSKAVLLRQIDNEFKAVNVSTTFNANKAYE